MAGDLPINPRKIGNPRPKMATRLLLHQIPPSIDPSAREQDLRQLSDLQHHLSPLTSLIDQLLQRGYQITKPQQRKHLHQSYLEKFEDLVHSNELQPGHHCLHFQGIPHQVVLQYSSYPGLREEGLLRRAVLGQPLQKDHAPQSRKQVRRAHWSF